MKLTVNAPKTAESNPTSFENNFFPKKNKSKIETEDANAEINRSIRLIRPQSLTQIFVSPIKFKKSPMIL